jgi:hypothetical protein
MKIIGVQDMNRNCETRGGEKEEKKEENGKKAHGNDLITSPLLPAIPIPIKKLLNSSDKLVSSVAD